MGGALRTYLKQITTVHSKSAREWVCRMARCSFQRRFPPSCCYLGCPALGERWIYSSTRQPVTMVPQVPLGSAEPGSLGHCFAGSACFHSVPGAEQPRIVPGHCCSTRALPTALIDHPTSELEARVRPCVLPTRSGLLWCTLRGVHSRSVRQGGAVL